MNKKPKDKINVLHLIHTMAYGGIETVLLNWYKTVDLDRFNLTMVVFENPGNLEEPYVNAAANLGIEVKKIPWARRKPVFKAAFALKKIIKENNIDIVHTHNCYADVVGMIIKFIAPVKTITTVYVWAKFELKRNLIQMIDKFVIRFFDVVSAHCQDTYDKTIKFISKKKLRLLICGFDIDVPVYTEAEREKKRLALGIKKDEILMANISRFYAEKAHDFLLDCFKVIVSKYPNARLWLLGVGPLEEQVREQCTRLGLDSHVKFVGFVENLLETLPLFDIQLHPSHMEGVSLSICSGLAAGLPIVASDVGSMSEVVHHNETGILVDEDDKEGYINSVIERIEDIEKRKRIGATAKNFIENDYSLQTAVDRLEHTYVEMME